MKCTNPDPCTGEMTTYPGLEAGKVECVKCGYRVSIEATVPAPEEPPTESVSILEENN